MSEERKAKLEALKQEALDRIEEKKQALVRERRMMSLRAQLGGAGRSSRPAPPTRSNAYKVGMPQVRCLGSARTLSVHATKKHHSTYTMSTRTLFELRVENIKQYLLAVAIAATMAATLSATQCTFLNWLETLCLAHQTVFPELAICLICHPEALALAVALVAHLNNGARALAQAFVIRR